jgi:hypothetical protein
VGAFELRKQLCVYERVRQVILAAARVDDELLQFQSMIRRIGPALAADECQRRDS